VFGVAACFKAPLRDKVSVPGRDERGTVLAGEILWSQGWRGVRSAYSPWLFGRYLLLLTGWGFCSCCRNGQQASLVLWGRLRVVVSPIPGFLSMSNENNVIYQPFKCLETSTLS